VGSGGSCWRGGDFLEMGCLAPFSTLDDIILFTSLNLLRFIVHKIEADDRMKNHLNCQYICLR
jgi:hypothetical protein